MRRVVGLVIVVLALLVVGCGSPAEAARHHHKHHPVHARVGAKRAPARVATRAEFKRLTNGMSVAEVSALFDAPERVVGSNPLTLDITTGFYLGPEQTRTYYTGVANRYDQQPGRACWAIRVGFIQDAVGVYRARTWENDSNICYTDTNRNY